MFTVTRWSECGSTQKFGIFIYVLVQVKRYLNVFRFMAYSWANSVGKHDEAFGLLKAGLEANPTRFLSFHVPHISMLNVYQVTCSTLPMPRLSKLGKTLPRSMQRMRNSSTFYVPTSRS